MSAERIGQKLRRAMELQGISELRLAEMTGRQLDHVRAVLEGYPNSVERRTPLDTAGELAAALGYQLDLTIAD